MTDKIRPIVEHLDAQEYEICAMLSKRPYSFKELCMRLNISTETLTQSLERISSSALGPLDYGQSISLRTGRTLLNSPKIYDFLNPAAQEILPRDTLFVVPSAASGNDYVKNLKHTPAALFCEQQTGGRGRYGRSWKSPFAAGLYLSVMTKISVQENIFMQPLSLALGVMVAQCIQEFSLEVQLKWPNDLLDPSGNKLCGILTELDDERLIAGIGINYAESEQASLYKMAQFHSVKLPERNHFAGMLLSHILIGLSRFMQEGFTPFYEYWSARDALYSKNIEVRSYLPGGKTLRGTCLGINVQGALRIQDTEGKEHAVTGGTLHTE